MAARKQKKTTKAMPVMQRPQMLRSYGLFSRKSYKHSNIPHLLRPPSVGSELNPANLHSTTGAHAAQVHIDKTMACTAALCYGSRLDSWEAHKRQRLETRNRGTSCTQLFEQWTTTDHDIMPEPQPVSSADGKKSASEAVPDNQTTVPRHAYHVWSAA